MKVTGNSPDLAALFPKRDWISAWKSQESFARHIGAQAPTSAWHKAGWEHNEEWTGSKSMHDALKLATEGWKEGVERIDKLSNMIYALNPVRKQPIKYGVAGAFANVPRAVAGNPLSMRIYDKAKSKRRQTITLAANMSENCGVGSKAITNKAATIAALIDTIEARGYSCDVVALSGSKGSYGGSEKYSCLTVVMLKESHQPMDKARVAFGLGHASMFRRLVFADWGLEPTAENGLGHGLGSGGMVEPSVEFAEKNIFIIPEGADNFETEDKAATKGIKWLTYVLQIQGCPAFTSKQFHAKKTPLYPKRPEYKDDPRYQVWEWKTLDIDKTELEEIPR